jgi:hypothetical protein
VPGSAHAVKIVNIAPANAARGLPAPDRAAARWRDGSAAGADRPRHPHRAGSDLDLIGSFIPAMREAGDAFFQNASLYIDTAEALARSGDAGTCRDDLIPVDGPSPSGACRRATGL